MQTSASPKSSRNLRSTRRGAGSWGKASLQQPGDNEPSVERGDPVSCPAVPWRSSPKGAGRDLGQEEPSLLLLPSWAKARVLSSPPPHGLSVPRNLGLGDGRERGRPDSDPGPLVPPTPPWTLLPRPLLPPPSAPSHQPCSGQQPLALQERMWTEAEAASASLALTAPGSRLCARHLLPLVGQLAGRGQLPHPWAAAVVSWGCGGQAPQSGRPETAGLCLPVLVRSLNKIRGSRCWAPCPPALGEAPSCLSSFRWPQASLGLWDLCLLCHTVPSLFPLSLLLFEGHRSLP